MRNATGPAMVYALGTLDSTMIKIGRTTNLKARFATIQAHSPAELTVHWQTRGGVALERHLHNRFQAHRRHGEWFAFPDGSAVDLIREAAADYSDRPEEGTRPEAPRTKPERVAPSTDEPASVDFVEYFKTHTREEVLTMMIIALTGL